MRGITFREMRLLFTTVIAFTAFAATTFLMKSVSEEKAKAQSSLRRSPQAIYSPDRKDPWNRIFYHLFTRRVWARVTEEFPESGPFFKVDVMGFPQALPVSTRLFERAEIGDRAVEPFYPSFISSAGTREVLDEPRFFQLKQSLTAALNERRVRPPLHRALMQADVWAAHDSLAEVSRYRGGRANELRERASQLLPLLAQLVKKLALTPEEIDGLPDNYALAAEEHALPDLFSPGSEWMEVQWVQTRMHDAAAHYRRAARVFLKPSVPPRDRQRFLDELPHNYGRTPELGAVALVIQNLVINTRGDVVPTRITYEVQTRAFERDTQGELVKTKLHQYELSRKLLREKPRTGGMVSLGEDVPMYLPVAGNDYGFATPQRDQHGETLPVLATLRARCAACHGRPNSPAVFTFQIHAREPVPPVKLLAQPNDTHARYVAGRKAKQENYQALTERWSK